MNGIEAVFAGIPLKPSPFCLAYPSAVDFTCMRLILNLNVGKISKFQRCP